ncbi:MAG TPA: peptide-binding protein, partial [Methylomirabilota bacterium]|nr:peptide-binding protein [Methylomirabilota bacterium]
MVRAARGLGGLLLGGACVFLAGCGGDVEGKVEEAAAGSEAPAYGDTFVQASIGDIGGLIPSLTSDQSSHEVGGMIYDGLVKFDKNLTTAPAMAE